MVRITGDCPLIDPEVIDGVIREHLRSGADYTSNVIRRTFPKGLDVEVVTMACLEKLHREAEAPDEREHVTLRVHRKREAFSVASFENDQDFSHLRWTLDTRHDYDKISAILGQAANVCASWKKLLLMEPAHKLNLYQHIISGEMSIRQAMQVLENVFASFRTLFVVDGEERLIGTLEDGDVRRNLIKHDISSQDPVRAVMNPKPVVIHQNQLKGFRQKEEYAKFHYLPVVDDDGRIIDFVKTGRGTYHPNIVVLMAGGLGKRLRPLTNDTPKPMLWVGGKPILETIIGQFRKSGFQNFYISVNYKAEVIKSYFRNGEALDVNIDYLEEKEQLGTAGALKLLDAKQCENDPILLMNGDILTDVNYGELLRYHVESGADVTVCVKKMSHYVPYGVVESEGEEIVGLREKPTYDYYINAGIYVLNPALLAHFGENTFLNMTDIIQLGIDNGGMRVHRYELTGYWTDIGQHEELEKATEEYGLHFG